MTCYFLGSSLATILNAEKTLRTRLRYFGDLLASNFKFCLHFWEVVTFGIRPLKSSNAFALVAIEVIQGELSTNLLAFYRSVFPCDHPQRPRSCALIGPHTSTCPGEQSIVSRDTIHPPHIEAKIRVLV